MAKVLQPHVGVRHWFAVNIARLCVIGALALLLNAVITGIIGGASQFGFLLVLTPLIGLFLVLAWLPGAIAFLEVWLWIERRTRRTLGRGGRVVLAILCMSGWLIVIYLVTRIPSGTLFAKGESGAAVIIWALLGIPVPATFGLFALPQAKEGLGPRQ